VIRTLQFSRYTYVVNESPCTMLPSLMYFFSFFSSKESVHQLSTGVGRCWRWFSL